MQPKHDISPWDWIGLPLVTVAMVLAAPWLLPDAQTWAAVIDDETGILEVATVVFCLLAIVYGARVLTRADRMPRRMPMFVLLGMLAAFYFGGEECSWGQTYLQWNTPESWAQINQQQETNLHNTSGFFNELPRNIMTGTVFIGGILVPLILKRRLENDDAPESIWYWLLPNYRVTPMAVLAIVSTIPEKLELVEEGSLAGLMLIDPGGELKEYAFAGVMMFYFMSMYHRLRSLSIENSPYGVA